MIFQKLLRSYLTDLISLYREELSLRTKPLATRNGDFINDTEPEKKQNGLQKKELNHVQMFGIALVAITLTFLHGWTQLIVKARVFHFMTFFESSLIFGILYACTWNTRQIHKSFLSGVIQHKSSLVLVVLQSLDVIWTGSYIKDSAANANRPDIYELFLVISIPSIIICMQKLNKLNIRAAESIILVISGIKLLILCRDPIFLPHTVPSIICLFISICHGIFLAILYSQLNTEQIVPLVKQLAAWKIPVAFLLAIFNGEEVHQLWSLQIASILLLMALLTLAKMVSTFLLLKYSNPLCCAITVNLSWFPTAVIRIFIFKCLFFISSLKLLLLLLLDLFVLLFKDEIDRLFDNSKYSSPDGNSVFNLK